MPVIDHINALEEEFEQLTDDQLRAKTDEFKQILQSGCIDIEELDIVILKHNRIKELVYQKQLSYVS